MLAWSLSLPGRGNLLNTVIFFNYLYSNKNKINHLLEISSKSNSKLKLFECDLLIESSFFPAMQNCSIVFHTASPFKLNFKNPKEELIAKEDEVPDFIEKKVKASK